MILTCASCSSRYSTEEDAIGSGRMVRCAACGYEWLAQPSLVLDQAVDGEAGAVAAPGATMALTRELVERLRPKPKVNQQLSPAALIRARQLEHEKRLRLIRLGSAWGGAAALLALTVGAGALSRDTLAEVWPKSASLFEALGLEVNATGLSIEDLKVETAPGPTPDVALVRGIIRNQRKDAQQAPPVRLSLLDERGKELTSALAYPLQAEIKGDGLTTFQVKFQQPPGSAVMLAARFAPINPEMEPPTPDSTINPVEAEALQNYLQEGQAEPPLPEPKG